MKTTLQKIATAAFLAVSSLLTAQADLTVGFNHSYNPPSNCNNQITAIDIDICNNTGTAASNFIVAIYLYKPSTQQYWVLSHTTVNSLSGNACVNINNWNIDMNNYCCLPAPGTDYRIGVWVDTAEVVTETDENNNASLLSGNIQVCANNVGISEHNITISMLDIYPNPACDFVKLSFDMISENDARISVTDINGKEVLKTNETFTGTGKHEKTLDVRALNTGVYFIRISSPEGSINRKLIVANH